MRRRFGSADPCKLLPGFLAGRRCIGARSSPDTARFMARDLVSGLSLQIWIRFKPVK